MALSPFTEEVAMAWRLFRSRWRTAVAIALVPAIPLLFTLPFVTERLLLFAYGGDTASASGASALIALVALIAFVLSSALAKAGLYLTFAGRENDTVHTIFQRGMRRFWPYVGTELLVVVLVGAALVPASFFHAWYTYVLRPLSSLSAYALTDFLALLILCLLLLPAIGVATHVIYAPLAVVVGDAAAGVPAIRRSVDLVRGRPLSVLKRLAAWLLLYIAIAAAVSPLPLANWLVPFGLMIVGTAFVVVLYKELKGR